MKNSSWCLHPSGLLTLPQDFAQSSHLLSLLSSPEPWLQERPTLFKQVCAHTRPFFHSGAPLTQVIPCCQLPCASLLCSPKLSSPATWPHYTQILEKPNVGTGVQPTSAFKAPNGASHSELGWGRSYQGGHVKNPVSPKVDALERGWIRGQAVLSALGTGN